MSKTVIFYCFNFSMGGTETLILRLIEYYLTLGYRCLLLTANPIDNSILEDAERLNFEHYVYNNKVRKFYSDKGFLSFHRDENPYIITQFLPEFLTCFRLLNKWKYGVKFKHIIYIVHPHSTFYSPHKMTVVAKWMISFLLNRKSLVFMDRECVDACRLHYKFSVSTRFKIFPLPILINNDLSVNKRNDVFNILSIARFEFPFKGYILGLVKSFELLFSTNQSISLTIIGDGDGRDELMDLIKTLPEIVSSNIKLIGRVSYNKTVQYLKDCDVYVGMATTVLDAANLNKIAITAVAYQTKNYCVGYFHDNATCIGEIFKENVRYGTFEELLEKIFRAEETEFLEMSIASKLALKENYDISLIAKGILNYSDGYLSFFQRCFVSILSVIHTLSVKLIQKFRK